MNWDIWSVCPVNDNYEISFSAKVRRITPASGTRPGKVLIPEVKRHGYYYIKLSKNNIQQRYTLHSLVALTYLGPRPEGATINHMNRDKSENGGWNIEYLTQKENCEHREATKDLDDPLDYYTEDEIPF